METLAKPGLRLNFPVTQNRFEFPRLFAMSDTSRNADPFRLIDHLPKGGVLIFRHYDHPGREALAREVVARSQQKGLRCLIAGDPALALKCGADGLHLPEYMLSGPGYTGPRPKDWIITAAAHSQRSIRRAEHLGLDAALVSPVFETPSHPGGQALGLLTFARLCRQARLPLIALGGVSPSRAGRLKRAGATGVAGISLFSSPLNQRRL